MLPKMNQTSDDSPILPEDTIAEAAHDLSEIESTFSTRFPPGTVFSTWEEAKESVKTLAKLFNFDASVDGHALKCSRYGNYN